MSISGLKSAQLSEFQSSVFKSSISFCIVRSSWTRSKCVDIVRIGDSMTCYTKRICSSDKFGKRRPIDRACFEIWLADAEINSQMDSLELQDDILL